MNDVIEIDPEIKEKISHELADILLYSIQLSDILNIPLNESLYKKEITSPAS